MKILQIKVRGQTPHKHGYARATRYGDYFNKEYTFDNSSSAVSESFDIYAVKYDSTNSRDVQAKQTLNVSIPKTPQLFTYDNDGNMLYDAVQTYYWDAENRLTKVEKTNNKKVEFKYDFQSRRTEKKVYNWIDDDWSLTSYIKFVYDGWNLVAELNGTDDSVLRTYVWGEDLSGSMQGAGGVGGLLSVTDASGTYYPCYDGNGNIIAYIDSTGAKVAEYDYNPFGKLISATGTKANDFSFRFSTKYFDSETGLYYYGYRYYSPDLGRWINRDPLQEEGSNNLYNFVGNNGLNKWDYLGLDTDSPVYSSLFFSNPLLYSIMTSRYSRELQFQIANKYGNSTGNSVVTKLIRNFVFEQQPTITLNSGEMRQLKAVNIFKRPYNSQFMDLVESKYTKNVKSFQYKGPVYAGTAIPGALGRFYKQVDWCLKFNDEKSLIFVKGTEIWNDDYDFNVEFLPLLKSLIWEPETGGRSTSGQIKVFIAHYGLLGKPFKVTSESIQTDEVLYTETVRFGDKDEF